jgi:hypothetical protein
LFGVKLFENVLLLPTPAADVDRILQLPVEQTKALFKLNEIAGSYNGAKRHLQAEYNSKRVA